MVRVKKAISLFAVVTMLCSMFVAAPAYVSAEGVALELVVNPVVLLPDKINSDTPGDRTITVDVKDGVTRPWNSGDALTVEVKKDGDGETYSISPITDGVTQSGGAISVVLTQTNVAGDGKTGWYTVNVKLGDVILGTGHFEIDNIVINNIEAKEGEGRVRLNGTGLASFVDPTLYAEVYQNGTKVATSRQTDFIWGSPEFQFDNQFDLSTGYTLKLFNQSGLLGVSLLEGKTFYVTPILTCTFTGGAPIISGSDADTLTISDRGNLWAESQNLRIQIGGPNIGYEVTDATVTDGNIQFAISEGDKHMFPWPDGTYDARIIDESGVLLGYTLFYVGTPGSILKGEVKDSSGNPVQSCGNVSISKIEADGKVSWERWVMVLPDGKFYLPGNELGSGDFRAQVSAPDGLAEADAFASFTATDGVVPAEALALKFSVPNISGRVILPDNTNCNKSVAVALFNKIDDKFEAYQVWTKSDGTFNIRLDNAGKYYLKARPQSDQGFVASKMFEVDFDGTTALTDIAVQFQKPQIVVTAKSPTGSALKTDSFRVNVEPVDHQNWQHDPTRRENDYLIGNMAPGQYRVYAVPEWDCPYARSFPQTVTVMEESPAAPETLDFALTDAKLTGKITNITDWNGYVSLYRKTDKGFENTGGFDLEDGGSYKIGGVASGDYYVRAELYDYPPESTYGPSVMTPVTISDTPKVLDLTLGDTSPRVVYVSEMQNGGGYARMNVVNANGFTKDLSGNVSLRAEIVNLDGSSLSPKLELSGENCFKIRWDSNCSGNETEIEIYTPKETNLPLGTYGLKLYDTLNNADPADDKLIVPDTQESNIFNVTASVGLSKYGFFPSKTGQKTIVESFEQTPLWASGNVLDVAFVSDSGVSTPADSIIIQPDNRLDITVPSLTAGNYCMIIKKAGELLAKQYIQVATPKINYILGASDTDSYIAFSCENPSVLIGDDTIIKVYSGTNLLRTALHQWQTKEFMEADFKEEPLPVGDYTVKVWVGAETDGNRISIPDEGAFKVVKGIKPDKSFVMENYENGTTQTMSAANGSVPWTAGEDLTIKLVNESGTTNVIGDITLLDDAAVTADGLTFQLPDDVKLANGSWGVMVNSAAGLIAKGKFDVINSSDIAFSGTVTGAEGGIATGAKIKMESLDRKYYQEFYTDADGKYTAYWIYNPGTYNVWVEPKETEPFMQSEPRELTIDGSGHCSTQTQNFTLDAARFINGTISLPSGTAASDMEFWIFGFSENGTPNDETDDMMGGYGGKIAAGSSSATYALKVPKAAASGFYLQLYINTNEYIGSYYYGSGGEKYSISEATAVDVSSGDQSGKDITLAVGKTIEGTLTIPAEVAIPAEGYEMKLFALIDNGTVDKHDDWFVSGGVKLTSSTQAYTLRVPQNPDGKPYKVAYDADPKGILELQGFYKSTGTVYNDSTTADPVDVSTNNATNIDLTARIRTDVETCAGFITALVNKVGPGKFVQPTAGEISTYETTYGYWSSMSAEQKAAMAIAVKNFSDKGALDSNKDPNRFFSRAACMDILAIASNALGVRSEKRFFSFNFTSKLLKISYDLQLSKLALKYHCF